MINFRREEGMTLIESLVAMSLLGIIIGPITLSLLLAFANTKGVTERTADSVGAQLLTAYFEADVASLDTIDAVATETCPGGGKQWLSMSWDDPKTTDAIEVTYVVPCGTTSLERTRSVNGVDEPAIELMTNFSTLTPTLSCNPNPCIAGDPPEVVAIKVVTDNPTTDAIYESYTFSLSATRRVSPS